MAEVRFFDGRFVGVTAMQAVSEAITSATKKARWAGFGSAAVAVTHTSYAPVDGGYDAAATIRCTK